jgi:predicted transposase YbfD/YdcC
MLQIKGNQPTAHAFCKNTFEGMSMPPPTVSKRNGRVSERFAIAVPVMPCAINIPFARSVIRFSVKTTTKGVTKEETFDYVLNLDVSGRIQDELLELKASHWKGSESRNHWIRDAQYKEDKILQRKPIAILNRSLLINACAFITNTLRLRKGTSTPALRESFQKHPSKALCLILRPFDAALPS